MNNGKTYSLHKSITRLILWWLHRLPIAHRRRTVERLLNGCGLPRRFCVEVASQIDRKTAND